MANVELSVTEGEVVDLQLTVPGVQGAVGPGIASGGVSGQVLIKQSASNYDTAWGAVSQSMISGLEISNAEVASDAGIVDTKLATIITEGKVANSATTATSAGLINTIVLRDDSGDFSGGLVTVTGLTVGGNASISGSLTANTVDATIDEGLF